MDFALETYRLALAQSPLSANSQRAYEQRVGSYLEWLATNNQVGNPVGDPLTEASSRDWAVRDYRALLKESHLAPTTINATISAIDHFYVTIGLGPTRVRREVLPQVAPRALSPADQKRFLRALDRVSSRDRAIGLTGYYGGLRVAELSALNISDVSMSTRLGKIQVWLGKGDKARSVPIHPELREALRGWLDERQGNCDALFVSRLGKRLSVRSIGAIVTQAGKQAGIDEAITPHTLRHTFATNLIRQGTDVIIVAELLGHERLDTTRRYAMPSAEDRMYAIGQLPIDA